MGLGCRFQGFRVLVERGWACFRAVLFMNVQATTRFRVFGSCAGPQVNTVDGQNPA